MLGAAPLIFQWAWINHSLVWVLYINAFLAGIFWPGLNLALNNRLMEQAPPEGRGSFIASFSAITGIAAFCAALLGGVLIDAIDGFRFVVGPVELNNYQIIFLAAGILRLLVWLLGRRLL